MKKVRKGERAWWFTKSNPQHTQIRKTSAPSPLSSTHLEPLLLRAVQAHAAERHVADARLHHTLLGRVQLWSLVLIKGERGLDRWVTHQPSHPSIHPPHLPIHPPHQRALAHSAGESRMAIMASYRGRDCPICCCVGLCIGEQSWWSVSKARQHTLSNRTNTQHHVTTPRTIIYTHDALSALPA